MKKKILGFLICMLFFVSSISLSAGDRTILSNLQPTVVIENPDDGAEVSDPYIVVDGYATGDVYITYWEWTWEWEGGSQTGGGEIDPPTGYYEFSIDIGPLVEGENTITVTFYDMEDGSGTDSVTVYYVPGDDSDPPEVVITSPDDGSEFEEPEIYVEGYADDHGGSGIVKIMWTHSWEGDQISEEEYFDVPQDTITFAIPITLREGENVITVNAEDAVGNSLTDPPSVAVTLTGEEGLLIDSVFQPVQTVYPHDPEYGDDLKPGVCERNCELDMVAGKNTFLFGYPYNERDKIKIKVHNNYKTKKSFHFVFKRLPEQWIDEGIIWKSDLVTMNPGEEKTFEYKAPIPNSWPFDWHIWAEHEGKEKKGSIVLYLDPDPTKPPANCHCEKVTVNVAVKLTHDLHVGFIPFAFKDGPNFPAELSTPMTPTDFDKYLLDDLYPWWLAIYPLRESGLTLEYTSNLRRNFSIKKWGDPIWVNSLTKYNSLNATNKKFIRLKIMALAREAAVIGEFDRVVFLVHPDIPQRTNGRKVAGLAVTSGPNGYFKHGVIVNWSKKTKTPAHEIGHTYGLIDCYRPPDTQYKAVGYWVNKKIDILHNDNNRCFMYKAWPIDDTGKGSWIKKPNFKKLINRFSEHRDPAILAISGEIDKDDQVNLDHWYKLDEGFIDIEWGTPGNYLVKAYDIDNNLIAETGFNISFIFETDYEGDEEFDYTIFSFRLEWISGIHRIDILKASSNELLVSRTKSQNTPQITIDSPSSGEKIKPEEYEIKWTGYDADGDSLRYNVLLKNDTSTNWWPIQVGETSDSWTADFSYLPKANYQLKILVTDDWNTGEDTVNFAIKKGKAKNMMLDAPFLKQLLEWFPLLQQLLQRFLKF